MTDQLTKTFQDTVREGENRVNRSWMSLAATGAVGGIDVTVGVLALMLVERQTHNELLGALAFGLGFIALTLANSELFTENFLVPLSALAAGRARWSGVIRLWGGTAVMNLAGGWLMMGLVMVAFPTLRPIALRLAEHFPARGIDWDSFALAMVGGVLITLMTWMEHGTESMPARLVAVVGIGFTLAAGHLNHVIIQSIEMFGALQTGAPFGYADWASTAAWAALGNAVGGLGLVTALRLIQVTGQGVRDAARQRDDEVDDGGDEAPSPRAPAGV